jgi:sugar lactone lactonase YvrE
MKRLILLVVTSIILPVMVSGIAVALNHVETVVVFDPNAGQLPEGVTVDKTGNVFISLTPLGELVKVKTGSDSAQPFGSVHGLMPDDMGLIGLAVDAPGNVYGTVVSTNPDTHGVWKFDRKTGAEERVVGTEAVVFPNSIAFDKRGTMYISDTIMGAVWRVPRNGTAETWIQDTLLEGDGSFGFPFPIGANGIAVRHNTVYIGVSEKASIVTVPILPDGSAGIVTLWAQLPASNLVDGIALDVHGNVYVAAPTINSILRVNVDGSIDTLATVADNLDAPTSIAFGTGKGNRHSLYAVNFSAAIAPPGGAGPSLVRIQVGVPGQPVP